MSESLGSDSRGSSLSVRARLIIGFTAVSVLGVAVSGWLAAQLWQQAVCTESTVQQLFSAIDQFGRIRTQSLQIEVHIRNMLLDPSNGTVEQERKLVGVLRREGEATLSRLNDTVREPEARKLLTLVRSTNPEYQRGLDEAVENAKLGGTAESVEALNGALRGRREKMIRALDDLIARQTQAAHQMAQADVRSARTGALIAGMGALVMAVLGVAISWSSARMLYRRLGGEPAELGDAAQRIASGDLSPVRDWGRAPSESVLARLSQMQQQLASLVGSVQDAAESIARDSSQVALGSADLSRRTEDQAASLQQTAASMEEITSTVAASSENARKAAELGGLASTAAQRSGNVVEQVVSTMTDITNSSRRIAEIIGVIDDIASQTNILALNAAVEAARAGESGRGFAVVAGEVRALAQRSAEAAREIKGLIGVSVDTVEAGSRLASHAGEAMRDAVLQVRRMADLIGQLSAAADEQTTGLSEINSALAHLDRSTQQNAALVVRSSAAADSLREQAERLRALLLVFRIERRDSAAFTTSTGPPPASSEDLPEARGHQAGNPTTSA